MTFSDHTYTDSQLREAWAACRRPSWPGYEACMADPILSRLVKLWLIHRKPLQQNRPQQKPVIQQRQESKPVEMDRKRLASGEREDD